MASKHIKITDKGIKITNARLSFPSLFKKAVFQGKEGKYEATLMFPKTDTEGYELVMGAIEKAKTENKVKVPDSKLFIKDGDDVEYDGCEGMWMIKASNNKRPTLLNRDRTQLVEEDEVLYAGCFVNGIIEPWVQNNDYGKRVNANLLGVQFVKDGEALGDGGTKVSEDDFDDIEDDDDL
jgi:hypothetical protein